MNVKELIEILSELPPDFDVKLRQDVPLEFVEVMMTPNGNWVWVG